MPYTNVMPQFGKGQLHSGSKSGPQVTDRKQAVAIMLNEKAKADAGDAEYAPSDDEKGSKPPFGGKKGSKSGKKGGKHDSPALKGLKNAKPSTKDADGDNDNDKGMC